MQAEFDVRREPETAPRGLSHTNQGDNRLSLARNSQTAKRCSVSENCLERLQAMEALPVLITTMRFQCTDTVYQ